MRRPYNKPTIETIDMKAEAMAPTCTCSGEHEQTAVANFLSNWPTGS